MNTELLLLPDKQVGYPVVLVLAQVTASHHPVIPMRLLVPDLTCIKKTLEIPITLRMGMDSSSSSKTTTEIGMLETEVWVMPTVEVVGM
jgi:hypothetical protein